MSILSKKTKRKEARTRFDVIFDTINLIFVLLVIFLCAYPIYYTLIASLSDPTAVITGKVFVWPVDFTLDSYRSVLAYSSVWTGYRNTIFYTALGTLYNLFLLLPASYALSRRQLKGRGLLTGFFIFTMYFSGGTVPFYLLIKSLRLIDNPAVMIIPGAFSVYNMIITRTNFSNFSESLREAAIVDGASELRVFLRIVLPLSGAIVSVMALYHAVGHWNSYFNALLFLNNSDLFPLQLVMRQVLLMNQSLTVNTEGMSTEALADLLRRQRLAETMKYSLIIIANLPILMAYPFVQKYFVKGVMIGSVKQ
ncbi:MAG: carbohydrate ABC transporter permease [Christensenellales bacterium]|jgi:putative aldouronate transport system permease protein